MNDKVQEALVRLAALSSWAAMENIDALKADITTIAAEMSRLQDEVRRMGMTVSNRKIIRWPHKDGGINIYGTEMIEWLIEHHAKDYYAAKEE